MTIGEIHNYRQAAPDLGTSGQPDEGQLVAIAAAGYEVIINLALHDDASYSLRDERKSVQSLGIEYVHIPVQFSGPTEKDLALFFDAMDRSKGHRVWVHCAANMRVTAFLGLYWQLQSEFKAIAEIATEQTLDKVVRKLPFPHHQKNIIQLNIKLCRKNQQKNS